MPETNAERTERSRRAILDAALPEFRRHGYAAASLNRIIETSGLTKGGFYFHFRSKQELALAVLEDDERRWYQGILGEIAAHPRAVDRLFAAPRAIARSARIGEGPVRLQKMVGELAQDPDLRDQVCGSARRAIASVTEQFRAAQEEGSVRADIDAGALAEVAIAGFTGMQALTEQFGDDGLERRVEALITVVQLAVLVEDPPT